jgi:transposase InsO family protein
MICDMLNRQGIECSYPTIYTYMKDMGLKATIMRMKQPYKSGEKHRIFDNLVNRQFNASAPNKVWCTDFTYLTLKGGHKRYNCSILDLYYRSIVATFNIKWIDASLAVETLEMAISNNDIGDDLILHSDQGSQVRQEVA